jgi:glycosyltransferase involved in cell wall biosynthesis
MKGKVGEALAAGTPVVVTTVAAEGMGLVDGETALVADTAEAFAGAVARLSGDPELWQRLHHAGRAHAQTHLGIDRMRQGVAAMLEGTGSASPARPSVSAVP